VDKLIAALKSGAFWGALLTTLGTLDLSQVITLLPTKAGWVVAALGVLISTFSRALHDALMNPD